MSGIQGFLTCKSMFPKFTTSFAREPIQRYYGVPDPQTREVPEPGFQGVRFSRSEAFKVQKQNRKNQKGSLMVPIFQQPVT